MQRFHAYVQRRTPTAPNATASIFTREWTRTKKGVFTCTLTCAGHAARGHGPTKRQSGDKAATAWMQQAAVRHERVTARSFDHFCHELTARGPDINAIAVVDGDNATDAARRWAAAVSPDAHVAVYVAAVATTRIKADRLVPECAYAVVFVEPCAVFCKDAADMLIAFRMGQLCTRVTTPSLRRVVIFSRDGAFEMVRHCIRDACGGGGTVTILPEELP